MHAAVRAGLAYFALVFAAGFLLGTLRVLLVAPMAGELVAVLVELPFMLAISWLVCRWLIQRFAVPPETGPRFAMGSIAFVLLVAAEACLALTLFGQSFAAFLTGFDHLPGQVGLAGQIAFALMPLIEGMVHKR